MKPWSSITRKGPSRWKGRRFREAAYPVKVVDTVGAGDAFVAGFPVRTVAGMEHQSAWTWPTPAARCA